MSAAEFPGVFSTPGSIGRRFFLRAGVLSPLLGVGAFSGNSLAETVTELPQQPELGSISPAPSGLDALHSLVGPQAGAGGRFGVDFWQVPRSVWLRNLNTGEEIRTTYWAQGRLIEPAYSRLCVFLRDHHMQQRIDALYRAGNPIPTGWYAVIGMSPPLLDILYALGAWLEWFGMPRAVGVTSAHRHPLTNGSIEGAAKLSEHQIGGAADIVIPDVPSVQVGKFGVWLRAGGVGFYPDKHFTHVDHGRVRVWATLRNGGSQR